MQTTTQPVTAPAAPQATEAQAAQIAGAADADLVPSAEYLFEAARASRDELRQQLDALVSQRHGYLRELEDHQVDGPATTGMQQRIVQLDARIANLDIQLAAADATVAKAAAIPGAVVPKPEFFRQGPPEEVMFLIPSLLFVAMLPIIFAYSRRIWKRGGGVVQQVPSELGDRLARLEQMGESTALEVERIGEGQRFVTRLLTDRADRAAIGEGVEADIR